MKATAQDVDSFIVLYGIPWESYEKITEALGEHHLRHTYIKGTLEMRSRFSCVTWDEYRAFLRAIGDRSVRHTYYKGELELMSPRKDHDWIKSLIGRMVEMLAFDFKIRIQSIGSTTITGTVIECGVQPDEAYYFSNEARVRGKKTFQPGRDPPPDLVVEVDVTNSIVKRLSSFAALRIPEIWQYAGEKMRFLKLAKNGRYASVTRSLAFPFLGPGDVDRFLKHCETLDENELISQFLEHARKCRKARAEK